MQWRAHKPARPCWLIAAFVLMFCGSAQAQEFEGAWKLTMRKLPNGTTLMPPAVQGAIIGQAGLWTRVVFWHTPEGKPASFSAVSTYKMSPAEYSETLLFSVSDDGSGKAPTYNQTSQTKSTPVTREGGRVSFKLPFDPPSVVIEGEDDGDGRGYIRRLLGTGSLKTRLTSLRHRRSRGEVRSRLEAKDFGISIGPMNICRTLP